MKPRLSDTNGTKPDANNRKSGQLKKNQTFHEILISENGQGLLDI